MLQVNHLKQVSSVLDIASGLPLPVCHMLLQNRILFQAFLNPCYMLSSSF